MSYAGSIIPRISDQPNPLQGDSFSMYQTDCAAGSAMSY